MATIPKTSIINRDYSRMTQPRTPTEYGGNVKYHLWDSRGRRLFPQRRPSIPTSANRNVDAMPCFPLFEHSPSSDCFRVDQQGHDSNTSSPSSVDSAGTVIVCTPDPQLPETNPRAREGTPGQTPSLVTSLPRSCSVELPITPYKSSYRSLETSFSAPLHTDLPARGNLQWKSMAQFHKLGRRLRRGTLAQSLHGEQASYDSDRSKNPLVSTVDILKGSSSVEIVPCQWRQWSQSPKTTAHPRVSSIEVHQGLGQDGVTYVPDKEQSRHAVPTLEIAAWDCTVKLSTVATVTGNGRLHVHHLALLSVITPIEERYAKEVSLSFVVTNAIRNDHKRSLGPGQSSLLFKEDISQHDFFPREGAELLIVRDSCDLEKPLNLYFAFTYPSPCHSLTALLPTFRPKKGRSISEVVFIAEPLPPLSTKISVRDPLSIWKLCHHSVNQVTCYERIGLPRLCPVGFQDDIQMTFSEFDPVCFRALGNSALSNVVWKLDFTVHHPPGGQVECRMSFILEVGAATALVSLSPHGWIPLYFIVDGRVATAKVGECWKTKEGYMTVFKQAHMAAGPIMIETYWQAPSDNDKHDSFSTKLSPLPGIADRKVLGGRLACRDSEIVLLNHLEERVQLHGPVDGTYTQLPTMDAGYKILLQRITQAHLQIPRPPSFVRPPFPPVRVDTHLSEYTTPSLVAKVKLGHEKGLSHVANEIEVEATSPKQLLQALFISLFVLLLLVPGFLLFVENVREESHYNGRTRMTDQEKSQAIIDAVHLESLQPITVPADNVVDVVRCKGWRDWVDYEGGWKGCVP